MDIRLIEDEQSHQGSDMDHAVTVATVTAAVLAIYEAILVLIIGQASRARARLSEKVAQVAQGMNARDPVFQVAAYLLKRRPAAGLVESNDRKFNENLYRRLQEVLDPGFVHKVDNTFATEARDWQELFAIQRDQDDMVRQFAREMGTDAAVEVIREVEEVDEVEARDRLSAILTSGDLQQEPEFDPGIQIRADDPPAADESHADYLLLTLAAIVTQWPFPCRIFAEGGKILVNSGKPLPLSSPDEIRAWSESANGLGGVGGLLGEFKNQLAQMIEELERTIPPETRDPLINKANVLRARLRARFARDAVSVITWAQKMGMQVESSLADWSQTRPSRLLRWGLIIALAAGAVITGVGVIYPLVAHNPWWWVYTAIPSAWFGIVAVVVAIAGRKVLSRL